MPSERAFRMVVMMGILLAVEHALARQGEGLLARAYFEDLAQAEYDREFWEMVASE